MADIKITGPDDADSGETTSQWGGTKLVLNVSELPSKDWQTEFNKVWQQNPKINTSVRSVQFVGTKMTILCANEIDPEILGPEIEKAVTQTNQKIDEFHQDVTELKF